MFEQLNITMNSIYVPLKAPKPPEDKVEALKASMKEIGLLNPLTVQWHSKEHCHYLIAGRTRFEAAKRLGWSEIAVVMLPPIGVDEDAEFVGAMARIAENVHRREIDDVERAELVAAWVKLQGARKKARKAEKAKLAQLAPVSKRGQVEGRGNTGGIRQAARDLSITRQTVERSIKIASLSPEAKEAAVAAGLGSNQDALLAAAKEREPEKQVEAITRRASSAMKREPAPVAEHPAPDGYGSWEAWRDAIVQAGATAPAGIRASIRKAFS